MDRNMSIGLRMFLLDFARIRSPKCFLKQVITAPLPPKITLKKDLVSGFHLRNCKLTDRGNVKLPTEELPGEGWG